MMNEKLLKSKLAERTYLVGGSVRDQLMGYDVTDHDYVVEATEAEFREEFPHAPLVGKDFPVFMVGGDEVALTRTERSTGNSYGAFELTGVGVSIVEDLKRRDLTINAIAKNIVTREIVDPYQGTEHIQRGILKAVFKETFEEDPVRILRVARFAARYDFMKIDSTTKWLMSCEAHRLKDVTKERIALEVTKLHKQSKTPSVFFKVLLEVGALHFIFPELWALTKVPAGPSEHHGNNTGFEHTMEALDRAASYDVPFEVFMAVLVHDFGKATTPKDILPKHIGHEMRSGDIAIDFFEKNKFPKKVKRFAIKAARWHMLAHILTKAKAKKLVKRFRIFRKHEMFDMFWTMNSDHPFTEKEDVIFWHIYDVLFNNRFEDTRPERIHEKMVRDLKERLKE